MTDINGILLYPESVPGTSESTDVVVEKIIKMVRKQNPRANTDLIFIAYRLAKSAHKGQKRHSGEPYIDHPVQVAYLAAELKMDSTAISAALLHDVIEDTAYTFADIQTLFGLGVAKIVEGLTKLKKLQYTTREEQQVENLRKMFLAMADDIRVVIIKLIDRLHNMRTLKYMKPEKQLTISKETLDVYAPLANRLGMSKIKSELEDLSLKYLDPIAYSEIRESISQKQDERERFITEIIGVLNERLTKMNIKGQITGRAKHFYSIFKKMYAQNKTIDELYDLFAVRIIVDTVTDCYSVLGMVHDLYTPIPMRFKDYVAMPKPNMYQSLHTTVIGSNGTPFEIQIRTWDMHRVAEEGIAAHWKYKEGKSGASEMDSELEWVRRLLDSQRDIMDTDEFMNTLKFDMFSDEVFTFTPNGKVIALPSQSTVIDFAFAIHSEIGCKMSGARVNGKIVPNTHILQNGDIVEILTSSAVRGPSRDWLKIVRTPQAKSKINQWLKRECRDENIVHGRDMVEKELRRINLSASKLFREEWVTPILKRYNLNSLDDLYASIGYGGLTAQKVVLRLRDQYNHELKTMPQKELQPVAPTTTKASAHGIVVKGIDNCLVRIAHCCAPLPGDEIIGFITKGRGVSVHRADCPNIRPESLSDEDKARLIDVYWEEDVASLFTAHLRIEAGDRTGMMVEIASVLSELKINCVSISAKVDKRGMAEIILGLEIKNFDELSRTITRLKSVSGVETVTRTNM